MGKQAKVLFLVPNLRISSGVSSFAINYFRSIDHETIQVDFAMYKDIPSPYIEEIRNAGGNIFVLPPLKRLNLHIRECRRILDEGQYDVVHNNTLYITFPMMLCAKINHIPVRILHSHNSKLGETPRKERRNKLFLPLLRALATDRAACSRAAGEAMFGGREYRFIPNVISPDKYRFDAQTRDAVRDKLGVKDQPVILTVGRTAEQKNPFFAMEVFQEVLKREPSAEYWWAGSGPLDEKVSDHVKARGLEAHVRLLGSRDDVNDLYQAADVFFLPSLFEGLPLTGIEAQAMGLPVVASDTITDEMVYTDLVDYESLDSPAGLWADALVRALARGVNRADYVHRLEESRFSDAGCGEYLQGIYTEMMERKAPKRQKT